MNTPTRIRKVSKEKRGRFCSTLVFAKELLGHTFFKTDFESEKKSMEEKLITKAWLLHWFITLTRIAGAVTETSYWQRAYRVDKFPEKVDVEFVKNSQSVVQALYICIIVLGPVLDIVVWRRRQLGLLIFYFEVFCIGLHGFIPENYGDFQELFVGYLFLYLFFAFGANTKGHFCVCILTYAVSMFVTFPRLYQEELTAGTIYLKLLNLTALTLSLTVLPALMTYMARIEFRLKRLMLQNLGLLDGMHEGIVVLSGSGDGKSLEFAN